MFRRILVAICAGLAATSAAVGAGEDASPPTNPRGPGGVPPFMFNHPHPDSFSARHSLEFPRWTVGAEHDSWQQGSNDLGDDPGHPYGEHHNGPRFDWRDRPDPGHEWHHGEPSSPNPEPASYAMMGLGLLLMGLFARRRSTH